MFYSLSYQMYKCEHGLSAAEQRAADARVGEAAAALRGLRLRLERALRLRQRVRPACGAERTVQGNAAAPSARVLPGLR